MQKMQVWSPGLDDPLEKRMATLSSILAWEIPWTEEPGRLQTRGHKKIGHNLEPKQQQYPLWTYIPSSLCIHPSVNKICIQFSSVAQSCPTLCGPMNYSTPGLSVHHQLLEFTQTHVHRVSDATQPSFSVVPFSSCPQSLPALQSFPMNQLFTWGGPSTGVSASASVLPKKSQGWSPSEWTGWISLQLVLGHVYNTHIHKLHRDPQTSHRSPTRQHTQTNYNLG